MACLSCEQQLILTQQEIKELVDEQLQLESDLVEVPIFQGRMNKCQQCVYNLNQTCRKCGCFVEFRCWLKTKDCPLNKW